MVRDASTLGIHGVDLEFQNGVTGVMTRIVSGADGSFHTALDSGAYTIRASKAGFDAQTRVGFGLHVGDRVRLDFALTPGAVSYSLPVVAHAALLRTAEGSVSHLVERKNIENLPLDGRNFLPLVALSPGVNLTPGSAFPRINGSRPRVNEFLYDGISVLQPEPGQPAWFPVIDAIEEFRVETSSYSAEYGRANGGIVVLHQKTGGNQMHGSVFEFLRNEELNARNRFATAGTKQRFRRNQYGVVAGGPIERNRAFFFIDWQGTRGQTGLVRLSTVPVEQERNGIFRIPVFDPATTRQAHAGHARDPFPLGTIPRSRWDPVAGLIQGRYPLPKADGADEKRAANNYRRTGNEENAQDQFGLRVDRYFQPEHRLFGRLTLLRDDSIPVTPLPDGSGAIAAGILSDTATEAAGVSAEHVWTLNPAAVNQLRFGHTGRRLSRKAAIKWVERVNGETHLPAAFSGTMPIFDTAGFQHLGPPVNSHARLATSVVHLNDTLTWARANGSIKAGVDFRRQSLDIVQPAAPAGLYQFTAIATSGLQVDGAPVAATGNSFASFLLGQVENFQLDVQSEVLQPRAQATEFFLQNDLRLTPRFSLNTGVRYTLNFPSTVKYDRGAVFDLDSEQVRFLGRSGYPRTARNLERANFAPRLGIAWTPAVSFVVRAGYGLTWIEQAGITTPFTTPLFPFISTIGRRTQDNIRPAFLLSAGTGIEIGEPGPDSGLGQGVFAVQRDQKSGYAQHWNLSLQKTFFSQWSFETGYVGSKLTNLGVPDVNLNQLQARLLSLGSELTQPVRNPYLGAVPASSPLGGPFVGLHHLLRPFPRFTTVALYRNNVGHSSYHSLQSRLVRRFSRGLTLGLAYTFSKLIDDAGAVFDSAILAGPPASFQVADSHNRRLEKAESTGHLPHVFVSSFLWELPGVPARAGGFKGWMRSFVSGWKLAGIVRAQSGSPFAVTQDPNWNAFAGFGIQRPNRIAEARLSSSERSAERWFATSAFSTAPQFTLGNSSRNPVTGPSFQAMDLMLGKTFSIHERLRGELRLEAFNAANTPPLGNPNGAFGTRAFGTISAAGDPRVFEVVWKLHF